MVKKILYFLVTRLLIELSYNWMIIMTEFMKFNIKKPQFLLAFMVTIVLILPVTSSNWLAYASNNDPYQSGYDHGCDDAEISNPSERYINQPEKGSAFHTDEFMRGYNDGFDGCSGTNDSSSSSVSSNSSESESERDFLRNVVLSYNLNRVDLPLIRISILTGVACLMHFN